MKYLPFSEEMIPGAGRLLAAQHARNRRALPLLPARFESAQVAEQAVRVLWQKPVKQGYAAFREGQMVAYLLGEYVVQPWARCGYVQLAGSALAAGEPPAVLQDLYARLGDEWVSDGVFSHGIYLSAADRRLVAALFDIGFGKEREDSLLDLRALETPEVSPPPGMTIRRAGKGDEEHLRTLSSLVTDALAQAPYWHPTPPERYLELEEGWAELVDEEEWTVWLALEGGQALGAALFRPEADSEEQLLASSHTMALKVGATAPAARRRGIANLLTRHGLAWARAEGYEICYCDWISANLPAARYWPRFGFEVVAYRLAKQINPLIAWTRR